MLRAERIILRPWKASDLDAFAALNADPEVMRYFPRVQTRDESAAAIERFQKHIDTHGFGFWAVEHQQTKECLGMLGLSYTTPDLPFDRSVEIGWRLASKHWGQGIAPEGAVVCLDFAFNHLELDEVISFTAKANTPSRRVMEKIGMTRDQGRDFSHPAVDERTGLREHAFYAIQGS